MEKVTSSKCILMCAGEYHPVHIEKNPGDLVIAVDGGLGYLIKYGPEPDFLLGDFDSLDPEYTDAVERFRLAGGESFLQLPVEKDDTDTLAAVKLGYGKGYRDFEIYGGLGNRLDHAMANIQTLVWLLRHGASGRLIDRETTVTVIGEGVFRLPPSFKGTVSLFALDRRLTGVCVRGMKYCVEDAELTNDYPIGCSNETTDAGEESAEIRIGGGTGLVVMTEGLINRHH